MVRENERVVDMLQWGVPRTIPGKRPGSMITKRVTNVRNLASPFWRSMLSKPEQRCLVPFTRFAEPKPNAGREEIWFRSEEHTSELQSLMRISYAVFCLKKKKKQKQQKKSKQEHNITIQRN